MPAGDQPRPKPKCSEHGISYKATSRLSAGPILVNVNTFGSRISVNFIAKRHYHRGFPFVV
jgi:hypothetical protein